MVICLYWLHIYELDCIFLFVCLCSGIGIVNAIEVLNAFPEEDGLLKFRQWVESPDPTILGKLGTKSGSNTRKKGSKVEEKINIESASDQNISQVQEQKEPPDHMPEIMQTFMDKHVIDLMHSLLSSNLKIILHLFHPVCTWPFRFLFSE